jgi:hypothetical protein
VLEVVVRPSQSPDIRPQAPLGLQETPVTPELEATEWGGNGNAAFTFSKHDSNSIDAVHTETKRTFDKVRVKNPDDHDQHVDVEVMTKYEGRNAIDKSRITIKYDRIQPNEDIEVLSTDNVRSST